ncbi:hypothetical protein NIES4101_66700 [Calothrix sp. NIES-4101]|nr:hypothetical protein NIES4101_66700 [Calothrix sp. NIES-4101]
MPNLDSAQDLRLLLPETVWLEAEHFAFANQVSSLETTQAENKWQVYLNTLALIALEIWLDDRLVSKEKAIARDMSAIAIAGSLKLGDYKFCAIATEHLLDEIVNFPQKLIEQTDSTSHFYVLLEVLEEEEEVVIRGFLPHNQLLKIQDNCQFTLSEGCYQIPLSHFDIEPNHLLTYYRYLQPANFTAPVTASVSDKSVSLAHQIRDNIADIFSTNITKLSQWLQGVIDEAWQKIDSLTNPELALAFSTRNVERDTKRAKIIDLGIELGNKKFALLLNISADISTELLEDKEESLISESPPKISVLAQLYPLNGERFLPPNVKLILLSKAGKTLQEVTARSQDNYIQLKPFKAEQGKKFSIQVSLGDATVRENFEL